MKGWFLFALSFAVPIFAQVHLDDMMSEDEKIKTGVATMTTEQKMELELWIDKNFVLKSSAPTQQNKNPAENPLYLSENIDGGKQLRLSDGSVYEIAPDDVQLTGFWITPFPIRIVSSQDPNYPFLIINSNTGTAVKAKPVSPALTIPPPSTAPSATKK